MVIDNLQFREVVPYSPGTLARLSKPIHSLSKSLLLVPNLALTSIKREYICMNEHSKLST